MIFTTRKMLIIPAKPQPEIRRFFGLFYLQNLKDGGVLGDDVDVCRNSVGDTHEDVDAIFGVGHEHLKDKGIMDPYELDRELKVRSYIAPMVFRFAWLHLASLGVALLRLAWLRFASLIASLRLAWLGVTVL